MIFKLAKRLDKSFHVADSTIGYNAVVREIKFDCPGFCGGFFRKIDDSGKLFGVIDEIDILAVDFYR